jgi:hypothetical protein
MGDEEASEMEELLRKIPKSATLVDPVATWRRAIATAGGFPIPPSGPSPLQQRLATITSVLRMQGAKGGWLTDMLVRVQADLNNGQTTTTAVPTADSNIGGRGATTETTTTTETAENHTITNKLFSTALSTSMGPRGPAEKFWPTFPAEMAATVSRRLQAAKLPDLVRVWNAAIVCDNTADFNSSSGMNRRQCICAATRGGGQT